MPILITAAASPLARALASALSREYQIRLTEQVHVESEHEFVLSPLEHDASTNLLVRGMDAILHVAEPRPELDVDEQIDYATRCTYNLLAAAAAEGVAKVIYLSSLGLMSNYDTDFIVDERWRPLPEPEPPTLTQYLGEFVCREFARESKVAVVVLRLARIRIEGRTDGSSSTAPWIDMRDVVQAVARALTTDTGIWSIYHIESASPQARFSTAKALSELGFQAEYNYESD